MKFVQLHRTFFPLTKDQQPRLEALRLWGHKFGGWLDWSDLRERKRVVLLAEASSGKSDEFQHQVEELTAAGLPAFMVRVEELADQGFEAALDPAAIKDFREWRCATGTAWFFLDALDEARVNRKSFETALKGLRRELDQILQRAHILISCRVSDWDTAKDPALVERLLPAHATPAPEMERSGNPLLDPIFEKKASTTIAATKPAKPPPEELLIVQLTPLSHEQCEKLVAEIGITNVKEFMAQIERNALDVFTDRPGDLLELAAYWRSCGRFGSLAEMIEYGITAKLREFDSYRGDSDMLSLAVAREGAERLAAALTFGKSFTLRAPNQAPDPSLALGAIDPALVLDDWTEAQRATLSRRGIFAPSTHGRIRFHHRATQEYLTACWLLRLLQANCPRAELWPLIFADRYGIETVVPSLRPAAAWLALWDSSIRDEIIAREPALLIDLGDPASLPLDARRKLLIAYARRHAAGELGRQMIEDRSLRMFADPALADAVRTAWELNATPGFRYDLLRLIRDGKITACADLARTVIDGADNQTDRVAALDALYSCDDKTSLRKATADLLSEPAASSARIAAMFSCVLYPAYLDTSQLLTIIEYSPPVPEHIVEGFPPVVTQLYEAAPDGAARTALLAGIAELCLAPPFAGAYQQVSEKHAKLAERLNPIARREVQLMPPGEPPVWLIRLLMVVERADDHHQTAKDDPPLQALVRMNPRLNRALFWADAALAREHALHDAAPTRWWQIHGVTGAHLWAFGADDLAWLREDCRGRAFVDDRRLALSALIPVLHGCGTLETEAVLLREELCSDPALVADLEQYLAPPPTQPEDAAHEREMTRIRKERAEQTARDKASWEDFNNHLRVNPGQLRDPLQLTGWKAGAFRLKNLTVWLQNRTERDDDAAPRDWRLLEEGFGQEVATAYRDGMKTLWRIVPPKRTARKAGSGITFGWMEVLAFGGIGLEASEDPEWAMKLPAQEAEHAAKHACFLGRHYPDWMDQLLDAHPQPVITVIKNGITDELASDSEFHATYLHRYAGSAVSIPAVLQPVLARWLFASEPPLPAKLELAVGIIRNLSIDDQSRQRLIRIAHARLAGSIAADRTPFAILYLAMLMLLDPDDAVIRLGAWITHGSVTDIAMRAQAALGSLFDRHNPLITGGLEAASAASLQNLVDLAYTYVRTEDDVVHRGVYSPGLRDNAEGARNTVLSILVQRPGAEAFRAMRTLAENPEFPLRTRRFRELAREKAEHDAELPPWTERETALFGKQHTAPVKTGADLLRVVMGVLKDINHDLAHADATSRSLLQRAADENEVQTWIVEQINLRSRGRLHAHREAQVARGDKPDVIVASTAAPCEVAVEIKHGGKSWTPRQFEKALRTQLAVDYLKPPQRRHGVFVITDHGTRSWRYPDTGEAMTFDALMTWLAGIAETLTENGHGAVEVRCRGLDASPSYPRPTSPSQKPPTRSRQPTRRAGRSGSHRSIPALKGCVTEAPSERHDNDEQSHKHEP